MDNKFIKPEFEILEDRTCPSSLTNNGALFLYVSQDNGVTWDRIAVINHGHAVHIIHEPRK